MNDPDRKRLDYAPPPRGERTRLRDLSLADWITMFMLAVVISVVLMAVVWRLFAPGAVTIR